MNRYIVTCYCYKTGKEFEKYFTYYNDLMHFINKCKYSKKLKILKYLDILGGRLHVYV